MMKEHWPKLKGQPIQEAVARFGYPQSEQTILGMKVYTWSTGGTYLSTTPTTAVTSGTMGAVPFTTTTVGYRQTASDVSCEIKIITTPEGIMEKFQYDGNNIACMPYAEAMKK